MLTRIANHFGWLTTLYATNLCLIALVFAVAEDRTYVDALWWGVVTSTTTGYGDLFPTSLLGRVAAAELMLSNIILVALIVTRVINTVTVDLDRFTHEEQERLQRQLEEINSEGDELRALVRQLLAEQRQQAQEEAELLRSEVRRLEQLLRTALPRG